METKQDKKSFWEFFIDHKRFSYIIVIALALFGLLSASNLPRESDPDIDVPVVVITTPFPGATAIDVEELVTNVIEDKLIGGLEDVDEITSTSSQGLSSIVVQFDIGSDTATGVADVKDQVELAKADLPEDADEPIVNKIRFSNNSILSLSLTGPYPEEELKRYAKLVEERLERIGGVSEVDVIGGRDREVKVLVDKIKLDQYELSLSQITQAIAAANTDIPAGAIETNETNLNIQFAGRITSTESIQNLPVASRNGTPILVKDIATVIDGYKQTQKVSRLSVDGSTPLPAIAIEVFKSSGSDLVKINQTAKEIIKEVKAEILPQDVEIATIFDQAYWIEDDLRTLFNSGIQTILIVMLILFIFIGWRESLLAGLAIPFTFLITFTLLPSFGMTLNGIVLFSLILSLGILVDSSIVVTEGMSHYSSKGYPPAEAARRTIREFNLPLTAGTLTTVFAFVPMLLASGMMGEFIKSIPITIAIVLMASLFVALGVITSLGASFMKSKKSDEGHENGHKNFVIRAIAREYNEFLDLIIRKKKYRKTFVITLIAAFIFAMWLPIAGKLKVEMFPPADQPIAFLNVETPTGTPLEITDGLMKPIENEIFSDPRFDSLSINVGQQVSLEGGSSGNVGSSHLGSISIALKNMDEGERDTPSYLLAEEFEEKLDQINNAQVRIQQLNYGPPTGAPVEVSVIGKDLDGLERLAKEIEEELRSIPGTRNVDTSLTESSEFSLEIDRVKAQLFGVSTTQIASTLRNAVTGFEATTIQKDGEDIEVTVRYNLNTQAGLVDEVENRTNLDVIESLTIATPQGDIALKTFLKSNLQSSRRSIAHIDGERVLKVTSDVKTGVTAQEVFQALQTKIDEKDIPSEYLIKMGGENEEVEQSYRDMMRAMILAIFLIAGLLVLQFNSFRQPLFIIAAIPLALIGVFPGLLLINMPLTFPGIIGVAALAGIVVNDAIILVDRINQNRKGGMSIEDAVFESAKSRLQPILITTITTVFGVLPLALTSEIWGPLAYSIIFGLIFSTVLTLLLIPLLYAKFAEKELD